MKFLALISAVWFLLSCSNESENCYNVHLVSNYSGIVENSPVVIENSIYGFVDEVQQKKNKIIVKICSTEEIRIPKDSKFYHGYIRMLGSYGFAVIPSDREDFYTMKDKIKSQSVDSLNVSFSEDREFQNQLIDIFSDFHNERLEKVDSVRGE